jgi:peptide/nickel transport system substrate-binding protein
MKSTKTIIFILMAIIFEIGMFSGAFAAEQVPSDTLTVALSTLYYETFLPWNGGGMGGPYLGMINEYLVYTDPETVEPKPGLAEKWEMSADGKTWTFWLRKGVKWHEGWGEFTAEDVKYTFERQIGPDSIAGPAGMLRKLIAKIEAPEPYKVVFYLTSPFLEFNSGLVTNSNETPIICKKYVTTVGDEKANSHPIGTGVYTLLEFKRGTSIKLKMIEGVEKHWRVTPEFKEVTFLKVPEESTRVAMLKTGEVDLAPINYDSTDTIKASGLRILAIPKNWSPTIRFGGLITTDPKRYDPKNPWADKRVRQALNYAVDKEALAKTIFHGEASPSGHDVLMPESYDIRPYPYDLGKAKQLLAEAGYSKGFPITLKTCTTNPGAELPTIGEAVAMYWKSVGLDVKIVPSDWGTVSAEWTTGKANNYVWTHRGMAFTDKLTPLNNSFGASSLFSSYSTKETEAWLEKVNREFDAKKRSQLARELIQDMHDEASGVFLVFANEPYGASKKVGHWPTIRFRANNFDMITHR